MYNVYYLTQHRTQLVAYSLTLDAVADKVMEILHDGGEITGIISVEKDT